MSSMKEIGGYFGLEQFSGEEYHKDAIAVNSGRNALLYILKARNVKKLYIPAFLCDTVYKLCEREGYAYEFYSVDNAFMPIFDKPLLSGEWLYIVNYYGLISNECLMKLKKRYGNVIFDNVQAFFQPALPGVDTVYSCRKFFGVPDGGYVSTDAVLDRPLPLDTSADRMRHILGRFEECGSAYYADFQANDENFYNLELRTMSRLTMNILRAVDYNDVISKRNANFAVLHDMLGDRNGIQPITPNGPYCYPFYCENGLAIKKQLASQKIYVATLWPNVLTEDAASPLEKDYTANILPLPCDQRYGKTEMEHIGKVVLTCLKT